MSDKGAGYFEAAKRKDLSREELMQEIEDLQERADLSDEEMQEILAYI
jgi:hypothetical protein